MATERVTHRTVVDRTKVRQAIRQHLIATGVPLHRAARPVDACSLLIEEQFRSENPCIAKLDGCPDYVPRHKADDASDFGWFS